MISVLGIFPEAKQRTGINPNDGILPFGRTEMFSDPEIGLMPLDVPLPSGVMASESGRLVAESAF